MPSTNYVITTRGQPVDNETPQKQLCQIRIMFTVDTDDEAIEVKKKISATLVDKPDIQVMFSLGSVPTKPPLG